MGWECDHYLAGNLNVAKLARIPQHFVPRRSGVAAKVKSAQFSSFEDALSGPEFDETRYVIQDQPAYESEYIAALALSSLRLGFTFHWMVPFFGLAEQDKQIDFLVDLSDGLWTWPWPVEIDGEFSHGSGTRKAKDEMRDSNLNPELVANGYHEISRIPWVEGYTVQDAVRIFQELFSL